MWVKQRAFEDKVVQLQSTLARVTEKAAEAQNELDNVVGGFVSGPNVRKNKRIRAASKAADARVSAAQTKLAKTITDRDAHEAQLEAVHASIPTPKGAGHYGQGRLLIKHLHLH
jgi:hypothetical protein